VRKVISNKRKPPKDEGQKEATPYNIESMLYYLSSEKHVAPEYIDKFADDQLKYFCENKDAKYINQYYLTRGVRKSLYYDWLEKSQYLKDRHNLCLEIIGLRREQAMEKANALILKLRQYQYDPGFAAAEERQHEMRKKEDGDSKGNVTVIMPNNERVIPDERRPKGKDESKNKVS